MTSMSRAVDSPVRVVRTASRSAHGPARNASRAIDTAASAAIRRPSRVSANPDSSASPIRIIPGIAAAAGHRPRVSTHDSNAALVRARVTKDSGRTGNPVTLATSSASTLLMTTAMTPTSAPPAAAAMTTAMTSGATANPAIAPSTTSGTARATRRAGSAEAIAIPQRFSAGVPTTGRARSVVMVTAAPLPLTGSAPTSRAHRDRR